MSAPVWRKSSRSGLSDNTDCVEVARLPGAVGLRDSKNPEGGHLSITAPAFTRLVAALRSGEHAL